MPARIVKWCQKNRYGAGPIWIVSKYFDNPLRINVRWSQNGYIKINGSLPMKYLYVCENRKKSYIDKTMTWSCSKTNYFWLSNITTSPWINMYTHRFPFIVELVTKKCLYLENKDYLTKYIKLIYKWGSSYIQ